MSMEKAMEFLKFLETNKELQEKMSGFTIDELDEAVNKMTSELSDQELSTAAGGRGRVPFSGSGWIKYFIEKGKKEAERR